MEQIINAILGVGIQLVVILIGIVGTKLIWEAKKYYAKLKEKDTLGIIDTLTDKAVVWAEKELKGKAGEEKLDYALSYATKWLNDRGIIISQSEILSQIEDGYLKLKKIQAEGKVPEITYGLESLKIADFSSISKGASNTENP